MTTEDALSANATGTVYSGASSTAAGESLVINKYKDQSPNQNLRPSWQNQ